MGLQTEREAQPLSAEDISHIAAWYAEVANPILRAAAETLEGLMDLRATRARHPSSAPPTPKRTSPSPSAWMGR